MKAKIPPYQYRSSHSLPINGINRVLQIQCSMPGTLAIEDFDSGTDAGTYFVSIMTSNPDSCNESGTRSKH